MLLDTLAATVIGNMSTGQVKIAGPGILRTGVGKV